MTLEVGQTLPAATLCRMGANGPETVELGTLLAGRRVVIFALPGAYTGVCSTAHVPSFMRTRAQFLEKGIDEIICLSVNDPFVMDAWGKATGATEAGLTLLGDADGSFTRAVGMDFTAPPAGLIGRSRRYAMVVADGTVTHLMADDSPGTCDLSSGESLLAQI